MNAYYSPIRRGLAATLLAATVVACTTASSRASFADALMRALSTFLQTHMGLTI